MSSESPAASESARRGADNVMRHCLAVQPGEKVVLLSWKTPQLVPLLEAASQELGASSTVVSTEPHASRPDVERWVERALEGASASVLLAEHGVPPPLSMAVLGAARRMRLRHLHLTRADQRLFEQSYRAEPQRIAELNERVRAALRPSAVLAARGDNGTDLKVTLGRYPLMSSDGRPGPGKPDNLPSGFVFFHPGAVEGTVVADRGMLGAIRISRERLRAAPVTLRIEGAKVREVKTDDPELRAEIDGYLSSHANAGRVGLVSVPTNYVVRAESGLDVQDALLPGLGVSLGFSDHEHSEAPFSCPVQLRALSRKLDVSVGARALVRAGRFADDLVAGIDPFR